MYMNHVLGFFDYCILNVCCRSASSGPITTPALEVDVVSGTYPRKSDRSLVTVISYVFQSSCHRKWGCTQ